MSASRWAILRELWREDGIDQRELSARVGMSPSSTVMLVHALQDAGLIRCDVTPDDRRRTTVRITRKARRIEADVMPLFAEIDRRAIRGMTVEEAAALRVLLGRLIDNLDAAVRREC